MLLNILRKSGGGEEGNPGKVAVEKTSTKQSRPTSEPEPTKKTASSTKTTDDGFKIVADDSDVSDAFDLDSGEDVGEEDEEEGVSEAEEEDEEDVEGAKEPRQTDDGFKIMSAADIPEDDSDFSDAFESDDEEASEEVDVGSESESDGSSESGIQHDEQSYKAKSTLEHTSSSNMNSATEKLEQQLRKLKSKLLSDNISASQRKRCKRALAKLQEKIEFEKETSSETKVTQDEEQSRTSLEPIEEKNIELESLKEKFESIQKEIDSGTISKSKKQKLIRVRFRLKTEIDKLEMKSTKTIWEILTLPTTKKEKKMFEQNKLKLDERTPFTEKELEEFKKQFSRKFIKGIEAIGKSWLDVETPAQREARLLGRLPPPEQVPGCVTYWARDAGGAVVKRMDYALYHRREEAERAERRRIKAEKAEQEKKEEEEKEEAERRAGKGRKALLREEMALKRQQVLDSLNKETFTSQQRVADRVRRLGVRTKNKCVNYKELLQQKQQEKEQHKRQTEDLRNRGLHDRVKKTARKKRKRDANDIAGATSLGGMFRDDSVLLVKKRRLNALKRQK